MGKGGGGTLGAQGHRLVVVRFGLQPGAGASLSAPQPEAQPQPGEGPPQAVRRHQERDQQPVVQPEDGAGGRVGTPPPSFGQGCTGKPGGRTPQPHNCLPAPMGGEGGHFHSSKNQAVTFRNEVGGVGHYPNWGGGVGHSGIQDKEMRKK